MPQQSTFSLGNIEIADDRGGLTANNHELHICVAEKTKQLIGCQLLHVSEDQLWMRKTIHCIDHNKTFLKLCKTIYGNALTFSRHNAALD